MNKDITINITKTMPSEISHKVNKEVLSILKQINGVNEKTILCYKDFKYIDNKWCIYLSDKPLVGFFPITIKSVFKSARIYDLNKNTGEYYIIKLKELIKNGVVKKNETIKEILGKDALNFVKELY